MALRTLHRCAAVVLGAFLSVHVANHLAATLGVQAHIGFMAAARRVYRVPVVETVLLLCVTFQVLSGLWFVARRWRQRRGGVAWLQAVSGLYIAVFLLIHVGAVLHGRFALNLDTNFYFAAAGLHVPPYQIFFVPYYFLSLVAVSAHLGCALFWRARSRHGGASPATIAIPVLIGITISAVIVLSLAGKLQPVDVPVTYRSLYGPT